MSVAVGLLWCGLAVASWPPAPTGRDLARGRLRQVYAGDWSQPSRGMRRGSAGAKLAGNHLAAGLVAIAAVVLVGGLPGVVLAGLLAAVTERLLPRLRTEAVRRAAATRAADLPLVLDLTAVALRAGLAPGAALALASGAIGGPLREQLARVAALSLLGSSPDDAWRELGSDDVLAPVARAVIRAGESGSALAGAFERAAVDARAARTHRAGRTTHRASVLAMLPLGLCFLPAFVCMGVVPVVVGVLHHIAG